MGFDPECVLQPDTVPGGYYCPLCRQLAYNVDVQQAPCGHLFCRPCVLYILGTTRCCPYENHPISENEPKNLQETNPAVYESLGRIGVRCLFYKSGCVWQGQLSDSASHSVSCGYGNSPVFCNRCGVQILHRQVQEHAQTCTGTMPQVQPQPQPQVQQQPLPQTQVQPTPQPQAQAQQMTGQYASGGPVVQDNNQLVQVGMQGATQYPGGQGQPGPAVQVVQPPAAQALHYPSGGPEQPQVQPGLQQQGPSAADQWYHQQYQQYYQQQYEQSQPYQQYEQYQQAQLQQQQVVQQQLPAAPPQQFLQTPQPYHLQEPALAQQPSMQQPVQHQPMVQPQAQQPHPQQLPPQLAHPQHHAHAQQVLQPQPSMHQQIHAQPMAQLQAQQPHPQQVHPQLSHPQQHPHAQPLLHAQPQPQPHPQQLHPHQPHPQQPHPQHLHLQQFHPQSHSHSQQAHQQHPHLQPPLQQSLQNQPHPHQPHIQQSYPQQPHSHPLQQQPHPQHPVQHQPQLQHPQMQQQMVQHQMVPPQHVQHHPPMHPLQQPPTWEQIQQPQHGALIQDGNQKMGHGHGVGQLQPSQDPNIYPQYAGLQQSNQQPQPQVAQQNLAQQWQGKGLPGQAPSQPQPQGFQQSLQHPPTATYFSHPNQHLQSPSQSVRQAALNPPTNQNAPLVPSKAVPLGGQVGPPLKPGSVPVEKLNGPSRSQQMQPGQPVEKAAAGQAPSKPSQQPSTQVQQDNKNDQAPPVENKDPLKTSAPAVSECLPTLPSKPQQKGDGQRPDESAPPSEIKSTTPEPPVSNAGPATNELVVSSTTENKQQPMQAPSSTAENKEQAPDDEKGDQQHSKDEESEVKQQSPQEGPQEQQQPLQSLSPKKSIQQLQPQSPKQKPPQVQHQSPRKNHQLSHPSPRPNFHQLQRQSPQQNLQQPPHPSPKHRRDLNTQGPQRQEPVMPSLPPMAGFPRPRAPIQPQQGAGAFPSVPNPSHQVGPRHMPVEAMPGVPPFMNPSFGGYPNQKPMLPGQAGPAARQQSFPPQGLFHDPQPHRRPDGFANFPIEPPHSPPMSRAMSPLTPSLLSGMPQKGFMDHAKPAFLPPPSQVEGIKPTMFDPSRQFMEQMAAFENEKRFGKLIESEKLLGPRPEDPFLADAQLKLQQRTMTRPEPPPQQARFMEGSPPRAPLDISPWLPPKGPPNSLTVPSAGLPHPSMGPFHGDFEGRSRSGIPSDGVAGREFPLEISLHQRQRAEFGSLPAPPQDMGMHSSFSLDVGAQPKHLSGVIRHGSSPDLGPRSLPDIGSRRTPPLDVGSRPPFRLDGDSGPRFPFDMEPRLPSQQDVDSRLRFISDIEPRPPFQLESNFRPKFFSDVEPRPPYPLDGDSRPRFPLDSKPQSGLPMDIEQRPAFSLDREPRPRFHSDLDSRSNFPSEGRSQAGFSMDFGVKSRNHIPHSDFGTHSDFLGPPIEHSRSRSDSISSMRSPGREPVSMSSRRDTSLPSGWREPIGLSGHSDSLHLGPDSLRFEDPRMKGMGLHPNTVLHDPMNQNRQFHHGTRAHQISIPGPGFGHLPPSFAPHGPPHGFLNGGPYYKSGPLIDEPEPLDFGRKRKQAGSSGWCRICHVDCYTVQGLEEHSQTEEHRKKTLDLVLSIKQDSAKKQKHANVADELKSTPKSTPDNGDKSGRSELDDDDDDDDGGSESE